MRNRLKNWMWVSLAVATLGLGHAEAASVGEVIFTVGEAKLQGSNQALKRGDQLDAGQTLVTGANGHVHIRFIDQAFVSVRPGSELHIEQYQYDQENPDNNRIKFSLAKGTSRFITGKAGQAAKDHFRLNTPVAAIGIRGTDFVTQATDNLTRVAVQQGGVVVSPFGDECSTGALGPCGGMQSRELAGSLTGQFLEVKGQLTPQLVTPTGVKQPFALPRPEEPVVGDKSASSALSTSNSFAWGRWTGSGATPAGYDLIGQNDAFVLYRVSEQAVMPTSGYVNFNIADVQAYGQLGQGSFDPAVITNPSLAVNFNTMKYATKFDWTFDGVTKAFYNRGTVTADGHFLGSPAASNIRISGALSNGGNEAAYLFSKRYSDQGIRAYGILRWQQ